MSSGKFVFISIAVLVLLSGAGCIDSEASGAPVNTPAPVSTETVTATATPEPTPALTETPWYVTTPGFENAEIGTYSTLFDEDVYGVKDIFGGGYNLFDVKTGEHIFSHLEYTPSNLDLDLRLQPEQYNALIDQYGHMESITMEQIDDDRDGKFDRVAVKYVGDEGVLEFETEYREGAALSGYIYEMIITKLQ